MKKPHAAILVPLLLPPFAWANAGTALMWAGFFYMIGGSLVIGIGEGTLLALLFRISPWKCAGVMILANYASFFAGYIMVDSARMPDITLDNAHTVFWFWIFLLYFITLLVEFPFVIFPLPRQNRRWLKALAACLLIQTVSYFLTINHYLDGPIRRDFFWPECRSVEFHGSPPRHRPLLYRSHRR